MKLLLSVGLAVHAVIGNLCMMPMAFAQDMPMPHTEHMEMVMTPISPMSPAHCEHCEKAQSIEDSQSQHPSECAGHCFSQANNTRATGVTIQTANVVVTTPPALAIAPVPSTAPVVAPPATAPPIAIHINTTVLRL